MPALVISRKAIIAAGACDLRRLDARGSGDLVYSQGFNASELARAARDNPRELVWLVGHGFLPVGARQVRAAILKEHGPTAFADIFGTTGALTRSRKPSKPTTSKQAQTSTTSEPSSGGADPKTSDPSSGGGKSKK